MKRLNFILLLFCLALTFFAQDKRKKGPPRLKVVTANLLFSNKDSAGVTGALLAEGADLIVLQEWNGLNLKKEPFLKRGYRFLVDRPAVDAKGMALLVRGPFAVESGFIPADSDEPCALPMVTATLILPEGGRLTLLGVHIPPPLKACEELSRGTVERVRSWVKDGRLTIDLGSGKRGDPVILAGDFNTLSGDKLMGSFREAGLVDSHVKGDPLGGGTWSPIMNTAKFARVDYIFVPRFWEIVSSTTFELPGSDHKGVSCHIILKPLHHRGRN